MNYYHTCDSCGHQHLIEVSVAKGNIVEIDYIPKECPACGIGWNDDSISEDIHNSI